MTTEKCQMITGKFSILHFSFVIKAPGTLPYRLPPDLGAMQPDPKLIIDGNNFRSAIGKKTTLAQQHW